MTNNKQNTVFIAFGSNIGNRSGYIDKALSELKKYGKIIKVSPVIETKPQEYTNQGNFLNGVLKFKTELPAEELLTTLKNIEKNIGRKKTFKNGPREIDLDIIFYNDEIIKTESLVVPHPKMHLREFVLKPLCEIAPNFLHPVLGKTIQQCCHCRISDNPV